MRHSKRSAAMEAALEYFSELPYAKRTVMDDDDHRYNNGKRPFSLRCLLCLTILCPAFFHRSREILRSVCRDWAPENHNAFDRVCDILSDVFPSHKDFVDLIRVSPLPSVRPLCSHALFYHRLSDSHTTHSCSLIWAWPSVTLLQHWAVFSRAHSLCSAI